MATVRNYSVYVKNRKFGELTGSAYDQESGNELQIGDGAVIGISQGVKTVQLQASAIIPFGGSNAARILQDAYSNNTPIGVAAGVINGQIHKLNLFVTKINIKSETKNGTCLGDFTLIGGAGTIVG